MTTAQYVELVVRVTAAEYPALEVALEAAGALSIAQDDGDSEVFGEPGLAATASWSRFAVTALFDAAGDLEAARAAIRAVLADGRAVTERVLAEQDWDEVWKAGWQPRLFAGGLCVCPSWCEPPAAARLVLTLDPGGAFGTGTHETTALCLDWLAACPDLGLARVLDYGCGSGILAIAAALLGARAVHAVDIDDAALAVAQDNVARNGLTARVSVARPESCAAGAADVLVANILMQPLIDLAPCFAALSAPGAQVVLAGLLVEQVPRVLEAYADGFTMTQIASRGEWALLGGRRH